MKVGHLLSGKGKPGPRAARERPQIGWQMKYGYQDHLVGLERLLKHEHVLPVKTDDGRPLAETHRLKVILQGAGAVTGADSP